jgi:hypothetical protein
MQSDSCFHDIHRHSIDRRTTGWNNDNNPAPEPVEEITNETEAETKKSCHKIDYEHKNSDNKSINDYWFVFRRSSLSVFYCSKCYAS